MTAPRRDLGDLARLAAPLAIGQLGLHFMQVVDAIMLGRYSGAALGGAGIAGGVLFAIIVVGSGTLMGLDTLLSQALGAGEKDHGRHLVRAGARLALVLSLPIMAGLCAVAWLLPFTGVNAAVAEEGTDFLLGRLPGMPAALLFAVLRSTLQAHRVTRPIVLAMIIGNVVNAAANWILIFGDDGLADLGLAPIGLPPLGSFGAAMATTLASWSSVGLCALAVRALHREQGPSAAAAPGELARLARAIIRLGLPIGLQLLAEVGVFALTGVLAGTLGTRPAAAHQVAMVMASFSFAMAIGIGAATSVQVGRAIGAGDGAGARRAGGIGIALGALVMGAAGILFLVIPGPIAILVSGDPDVVDVAVPLLRVAAVFQLSDAIQAVSAGGLRGAGDTRSTMYFNLAGHYGIGVPIAVLLCFGAGMGATGLWWGLSAGLTAVAIAQTLRFARLTGRPIVRAAH